MFRQYKPIRSSVGWQNARSMDKPERNRTMKQSYEKAYEAQQQAATGMMDEAMRGYEQNIRTGFKMQEEAGKWLMHVVNQASSPEEWRRRISKMADEMIPVTQKNMTDSLKLIEENSRTGVTLARKVMEATQATSFADSQNKWVDFWDLSMKSMRSNAQTLQELNGRTVESWIDFLWRNGETNFTKAAKAS